MASFDTGRLCAIVKILDKASTHLREAAVECAAAGSTTAVPRQDPDPTATGIAALLDVSEHASVGVRRALLHINNGEAQRAQHELDAVRVEPSGVVFAPAGLPRPLPPRVATALRLMLGINGFFPSETEQVLVRAAVQ
ncbi:hypothetical protein [Streptomyces sp. NRRL S-920]|uniref:hypothetical protein n=1 Tax=Streptomyces sp. NRRL S-920 TaxID=1463921 RepID=UPI0004CB292E|nr:hypothetical protein [Streptomyces sp. NRRL S-920]